MCEMCGYVGRRQAAAPILLEYGKRVYFDGELTLKNKEYPGIQGSSSLRTTISAAD